MAYLTEAAVRARAARVTQPSRKTARRILSEAASLAEEKFDIFLSHSSAEPEELLLGIKLLLEDEGFSVYVDKYSDPQLEPDRVSRDTADILRLRMGNSKILLYVHSVFSRESRWMPWELGYFDGLKGKVGVIPVTKNQEETFKGEEYLSLYPYVDTEKLARSDVVYLWISESPSKYTRLDLWVRGKANI